MTTSKRLMLLPLIALLFACSAVGEAPAIARCDVTLIVLGVGQDGGKPQIGNPGDDAWTDRSLRRLATSIALVDARAAPVRRWLFDATPDMKEQLHRLDSMVPVERSIDLDGIFLTHAHVGHYTGLMLLGHESAGANAVAVHAMPRMQAFLESNGPWDQLVRYDNIVLSSLTERQPVDLGDDLRVTPFLVPHRQEYSEVVGYRIDGPTRAAIFLPDIDSWEDWDTEGTRIEDVIASADVAFLDATFYSDQELPGRDMSGFPHPFVLHSLARFAALPATEKRKIHLVHMNHSNPVGNAGSPERERVIAAGYGVASEGMQFCL